MPKKNYHHGDLQTSLLRTAEILLEEKGKDGVSLREVAKEANVSHSAPYRHYKDKKALLAALATKGFQELADTLQQCEVKYSDDPLKLLFESCNAYVKQASKKPKRLDLMFGETFQPEDITNELTEQSNRSFNQLLRIVHNGQAKNLFTSTNPEELALFIWSTVHGLSTLQNTGHTQTFYQDENQYQKLLNRIWETILNGIKK